MNLPIADRKARVATRTRLAPTIVATACALPEHRYDQRDLAAIAARTLPEGIARGPAIQRFFQRVGVRSRHFALPVERYAALRGLRERNDAWIETALALGERVVRSALAQAGLEAHDVGLISTTTVTGIAVPSIEARLMNRVPFAEDMVRVPLFGLGCLGGAAGVARVADYLRAYPEKAAMLLSVELCSLTFQPHDASVANLVSSGLFGDGAACVLMVGAHHPLAERAAAEGVTCPRAIASRSAFFRDTERVMGWDVVDSGFQVVLGPDVPAVVRAHVPGRLDAFLGDHGLRREDVGTWVIHPGGPKVIDAMEEVLGVGAGGLAATRESLETIGNLSSASVLFLLDEHRRARAPEAGGWGVLMAMGPAFCAEMVLLRW